MIIRYLAFCGNKDQKPNWQNMGKMAKDQKEYCSKARIPLKNTGHSLSGRSTNPLRG